MELTIGDRVTIKGIEYGINVVDGEPELVKMERRLVAGDCLNIDGNYCMLVSYMDNRYSVVRLSTGEICVLVNDKGLPYRPYISEIKKNSGVNDVKLVTKKATFSLLSEIVQE